jgi:hypothetical protein
MADVVFQIEILVLDQVGLIQAERHILQLLAKDGR